jgi:hypothetical protein
VHEAAPIFMLAFLVLTVASLLPFGFLLARRMKPPEPSKALMARLRIPVTCSQARLPQTVHSMAGLHLRAPPTFPDQPGDLSPANFAGSGLAALTPASADVNPH